MNSFAPVEINGSCCKISLHDPETCFYLPSAFTNLEDIFGKITVCWTIPWTGPISLPNQWRNSAANTKNSPWIERDSADSPIISLWIAWKQGKSQRNPIAVGKKSHLNNRIRPVFFAIKPGLQKNPWPASLYLRLKFHSVWSDLYQCSISNSFKVPSLRMVLEVDFPWASR